MMPKIDPTDILKRPEPNAVRMSGLLGERFDLSRTNRLIHQEEDHLLFPFQLHCPVGFAHLQLQIIQRQLLSCVYVTPIPIYLYFKKILAQYLHRRCIFFGQWNPHSPHLQQRACSQKKDY